MSLFHRLFVPLCIPLTVTFINECNNIQLNQSNNEYKDEDEDELLNNINSKYYNIQNFNSEIKYDQNSAFSLCHTNIASISKHIDELRLHCITNFDDVLGTRTSPTVFYQVLGAESENDHENAWLILIFKIPRTSIFEDFPQFLDLEGLFFARALSITAKKIIRLAS